MRAPGFWLTGGPMSAALAPLGWAWEWGSRLRGAWTTAYRPNIPVICIGNVVAGGAGKTPVALSIAHRVPGAHFLSRGYGGEEVGPLLVNPRKHNHLQVGDEPLLLAEVAPCWVAKDRVAGAKAAAANDAACLIMDDGYQNPSLQKTISLLVVDGHTGFGNGRCIPAGPLRESVDRALSRASAVVIVGEDRAGVAARVTGRPILRARQEPEAEASVLAGRAVVAFAGIGRPEKFFHTLDGLGARVVEAYAFPDHYSYLPSEIAELAAIAETNGAALITTTKDIVRVPAHVRDAIGVLRIVVTWEDEAALFDILQPVLKGAART
ncbi:tetraacyldisaccharide 4'-kinase [Telmatospirillum sp.]|uniref:tetraacyldisaccharide 4'-kinase n=1 Tax=Telmatospirillum sp. TaxID=2079197 RepID=UPI002844659C|nr:tetraacyldisaccharide 4'-kinase [Telmatospirillum sp.]MDR3435902.1 tetraacyldisaccharide 4'-kinase [Telmatospirillum sp.]